MKNLVEFEGINLNKAPENSQVIQLVSRAMELANSIADRKPQSTSLNSALYLSLLTANSLLTSASAECTLHHPPEEIDVVVNSDGNLIYRCYHSPCHEWDLSGNKIS